MRRNAKGQISIELLLTFAIMLLLFIGLMNAWSVRNAMYHSQVLASDADVIAANMGLMLDSAYVAGTGSNIIGTIPETIGVGKNFNLTVHGQEHLVIVRYSDGERGYQRSFPITPGEITGELQDIEGTINVSNNQGALNIEKLA